MQTPNSSCNYLPRDLCHTGSVGNKSSKKSLIGTLGMLIEYCASAAALKGTRWRGGRFLSVEEQKLWILTRSQSRRLNYKPIGRLFPSNWKVKNRKLTADEVTRIEALVSEGKFDIAMAAIGAPWGEYSGRQMRQWWKATLKKLNRFNTSPVAQKYGVFLLIGAAQVDVAVGTGTSRECHPHLNLILAVRKDSGGKGQLFRFREALAKIRKAVGYPVGSEEDFFGVNSVQDGSIAKIVGYLTRYPIGFKNLSDPDSRGRPKSVAFGNALRLGPMPEPESRLRALTSNEINALSQVPPADYLTDPLALAPAFEAIAGFRSLRIYRLPGDKPKGRRKGKKVKAPPDLGANDTNPCPPKAGVEGDNSAPHSTPSKAGRSDSGLRGSNPVNRLISTWLDQDPLTDMWRTCALVQNMTTRHEFLLRNPAFAQIWALEAEATKRNIGRRTYEPTF